MVFQFIKKLLKAFIIFDFCFVSYWVRWIFRNCVEFICNIYDQLFTFSFLCYALDCIELRDWFSFPYETGFLNFNWLITFTLSSSASVSTRLVLWLFKRMSHFSDLIYCKIFMIGFHLYLIEWQHETGVSIRDQFL